jgi:hypothetical protein
MTTASTRVRLGRAVFGPVAAALVMVAPAGPIPAGPIAGEGQGAEAGRCLSPFGTLFRRQAPDQPWTAVDPKQPVPDNTVLLALPGGRAEVESANGAVRLELWGNMPELSPSPVLGSAVVLHHEPGVDLSLTFERGRIVLVSTRARQPVRVRVLVGKTPWEITLHDKGDEAALELYGRWPHGVPFSREARSGQGPTLVLECLDVAGGMDVKTGGDQFTMHAAPGLNYLHWDSAGGLESGPQRLAKPPRWYEAGSARSPEALRVRQVEEKLRERLRDQGLERALANLFASADADRERDEAEITRAFVVFSWGATDNLARLLVELGDPKHAEVREAAVEALRHWIGRGPGQDQKLYGFLKRREKYSPAQAEVVLDLLHSPFDREAPETYQTLIGYLRSDRASIRELAVWHLDRLAPAGRSIRFNPGGPPEEREKAYAQWKKLIPDGSLPPKRK